MSFRARAIAVTAACLLLASSGSALARTSPARPVQVTGKQLKTALLPASDFGRGYVAAGESDSGRKLQPGGWPNIRSMSCDRFWFMVTGPGFGQTAYAADFINPNGDGSARSEFFDQGVEQFASKRAAASFYGQVAAKFRACRSITVNDTGFTLRIKLLSETRVRVGGRQAFQLVSSMGSPGGGGPQLRFYRLFTVGGAYVYYIDTMLMGGPPRPSQSSLTLKLIARVRAL